MAYPISATFNVLYPTRRKMANILKKIIMSKGLFQEGTLVESIRINAKVPALGNIEIEIIAMYYFMYLNNGADLWNGGRIEPYELVAKFTQELNSAGITAEIYRQYTEWLVKKYPIMDIAKIYEGKKSIIYSFVPIAAPATWIDGFPLDV